jgi:hypothetical protein
MGVCVCVYVCVRARGYEHASACVALPTYCNVHMHLHENTSLQLRLSPLPHYAIRYEAVDRSVLNIKYLHVFKCTTLRHIREDQHNLLASRCRVPVCCNRPRVQGQGLAPAEPNPGPMFIFYTSLLYAGNQYVLATHLEGLDAAGVWRPKSCVTVEVWKPKTMCKCLKHVSSNHVKTVRWLPCTFPFSFLSF